MLPPSERLSTKWPRRTHGLRITALYAEAQSGDKPAQVDPSDRIEALSGGFRSLDDPGGAARADKGAFVWVSAGLLLNAALITTVGFIVSCTLCYVLAVQGLRRAAGQRAGTVRTWCVDLLTGVLISAPVFWAFTQFLAINLPGLTQTGWL